MPDAFIVTVNDASGRFETDLEIPSRLPFSAFKAKLLEILKIMDNRIFYNWNDYRLSYKSRAIGGSDTLASLGAFDGSRLTVEKI
jgi:uncharacterized ubiquitin-like protein YukD